MDTRTQLSFSVHAPVSRSVIGKSPARSEPAPHRSSRDRRKMKARRSLDHRRKGRSRRRALHD
eukprot:824470-Prymnesium_polylepis.2